MSKDSIVEGIEFVIDKLDDLMFDVTSDLPDDDDYDSPEWDVRDILDEAMEKLQYARMKAIEVLK